MKRFIVSLLVLGSMVFAGNMAQGKKHMKMFQSVPMQKATILQKGKAKMFCPECGMTLPMFYKTNHAATLNGEVKQFCSMHCLVEAGLNNDRGVQNIKVVDVTSLKFIDARNATYVVGSSKKGTMTMNSKYAFAHKSDAKKFAKQFGGKVMSFDKAYAIASKAFVKEKKMIAKKQAKMAKKGEMMYNKMCKKTDLKFGSTAEAKAYLKSSGICGNIKGKKLQAIGIYLGRR
jgi:nitrous oxide reductase accessory protein NosL